MHLKVRPHLKPNSKNTSKNTLYLEEGEEEWAKNQLKITHIGYTYIHLKIDNIGLKITLPEDQTKNTSKNKGVPG
jgi:hypothetical protein